MKINMENTMQVFSNVDFGDIRVFVKDGTPWFNGPDTAKILGYKNVTHALARHVDEEDKKLLNVLQPETGRSIYCGLQVPSMINESGLYSLILGSKLPDAKRFKRWVTSDVLPTIRKNGIYATETTIDAILDDPDFGIKLLEQLKEERKEKAKLQGEVNIMQPKAEYYDSVMNSPGLLDMTTIAKDYGMSAQKMNMLLNAYGVQYKDRTTKCWVLYSQYQDYGYVKQQIKVGYDGVGHTHTYWTQTGRAFLYDFLKKKGIYPVQN